MLIKIQQNDCSKSLQNYLATQKLHDEKYFFAFSPWKTLLSCFLADQASRTDVLDQFGSQFIGRPSCFHGIKAGLLKKTGRVIALICNVVSRRTTTTPSSSSSPPQPHATTTTTTATSGARATALSSYKS